MNLILYSDQIIPKNAAIDDRLLDMLTSWGAGRRLAYIPSGPEPDRRFYHQRQSYYARLGLELDTFFEPDPNDVQSGLDRLFASDAIHISGGSTAGFLRRLRAAAMLQPLREWARKGGVLIGTSAGAILMTPTIAVDALFSKAEPREMNDADALNLVPFEYFPHLDADRTYLPQLVAYSRATARCIIACKNGDGVVVSNNRVSMVGDPILIFNGSFEPARDFALA